MLSPFQKTILREVSFKGVGLHSGLKAEVKILPTTENYGIVFKRTDLDKNNLIKASFENVCSTKLCTTLENENKINVSTVEHLLAALYITGIDNALIEVNNSEVPIMDGSSKEFVENIKEVGVKNLNAKRKYLKIVKKFEFKEDERVISIEPNADSLKVDFQLVYSNIAIGTQSNQINFADTDLKNVYTSRTFCLFEDIEKIKKVGLAKGGSLDNAIVVKNNEILNNEGLRNNKEFVNHKILDLVGDFLLSGHRILGSVKCSQGGHSLSNLFLRAIFKDKSNFVMIEQEESPSEKNYFKTSTNKLAVNA
jgi:UDP-3-O-[3-hydroxymyristoyl] N-acetylglucosamine deacetylase|tara:strand:- start:1561 stop:2487 length:927 start_codon:yes stop_codon:yes gene_type:complete